MADTRKSFSPTGERRYSTSWVPVDHPSGANSPFTPPQQPRNNSSLNDENDEKKQAPSLSSKSKSSETREDKWKRLYAKNFDDAAERLAKTNQNIQGAILAMRDRTKEHFMKHPISLFSESAAAYSGVLIEKFAREFTTATEEQDKQKAIRDFSLAITPFRTLHPWLFYGGLVVLGAASGGLVALGYTAAGFGLAAVTGVASLGFFHSPNFTETGEVITHARQSLTMRK